VLNAQLELIRSALGLAEQAQAQMVLAARVQTALDAWTALFAQMVPEPPR
jgi:hypothetical protein